MNYIDTREPKKEIETFTAMGDWEPRQLEAGDFVFPATLSGSVGIERKEVTDLMSSLYPRATFEDPSPRSLSKQLAGMKRLYTHRILLIEGFMSNTWDGNVKTSTRMFNSPMTAVQNYLMEMQLQGVAAVVYSSSPAQTRRQVLAIGSFFNKTKHEAFSEQPVTVKTAANPLVAMLLTIPGMGLQKAEGVARKYATVVDLCQADIKSIMLVPGVGRALAERIYLGFHGAQDEVGIVR